MSAVARARAFQFVELGETGAEKAGGSRASAHVLFRNALREAAEPRPPPAAGAGGGGGVPGAAVGLFGEGRPGAAVRRGFAVPVAGGGGGEPDEREGPVIRDPNESR